MSIQIGDVTIEIKDMDFPRSTEPKKWEKYLGRKLVQEECMALFDVRSEKKMNMSLYRLDSFSQPKELYIPRLTNLYGNCLFESLSYHQVCDDSDEFRKGIAHLLYLFQDVENIFPNQKETLKELFEPFNEVGQVFCSTNRSMYKYSFNTMCQDLAKDSSWARLPTQLILMFLSFIFKLEFIIIHENSGWEDKINVYSSDTPDIKKVYLGLLGEFHYVPLDVKPVDSSEPVPEYMEARRKFFKWGSDKWHNRNINLIQSYIHKLENQNSE